MELQRLNLLERLTAFYTVFIGVSLAVVAFSTWEILNSLRGVAALLSLPAGIVLLLSGAALVLEFYFGFKVDLKELRR